LGARGWQQIWIKTAVNLFTGEQKLYIFFSLLLSNSETQAPLLNPITRGALNPSSFGLAIVDQKKRKKSNWKIQQASLLERANLQQIKTPLIKT
jgi:phage head maturation protease